MISRRALKSLVAFAAITLTTCASAQPQAAPPNRAGRAPETEEARQVRERNNAMPDPQGSGPYAAMKEETKSLADHVIYRPADLSKVGNKKLGLVVWGNGGCSADGASQRLHLLQIASHGYLAIANGTIKSGPGVPPGPPRGTPAAPAQGAPRSLPAAQTTAAQLTQAIDWALAENSRPGSPYYGKLDPAAVAVSGYSCGGIQALQVASDPRVKAVVIHNSGIFIGESPMAEMNIGKAALDKLHTPVIYILGGQSDMAYENGMDDFKRITKVPVMAANLGNVGHGGSFLEPNGGAAALVHIAWLDWQLKGDAKAARQFTGADCGLCKHPAWKVQRNGL